MEQPRVINYPKKRRALAALCDITTGSFPQLCGFFLKVAQAGEAKTFPLFGGFSGRLQTHCYNTLVKLTWHGDLEGDAVRAREGSFFRKEMPRCIWGIFSCVMVGFTGISLENGLFHCLLKRCWFFPLSVAWHNKTKKNNPKLKIASLCSHVLLQSTETSPASSLQSLPISPCSEKSLPWKVT